MLPGDVLEITPRKVTAIPYENIRQSDNSWTGMQLISPRTNAYDLLAACISSLWRDWCWELASWLLVPGRNLIEPILQMDKEHDRVNGKERYKRRREYNTWRKAKSPPACLDPIILENHTTLNITINMSDVALGELKGGLREVKPKLS